MNSCKTLSQSAQVAITKYHKLSVLNNRHVFLTVLKSGKSIRFLVKAFFLACRWLSSCCVLTRQKERVQLHPLWLHLLFHSDTLMQDISDCKKTESFMVISMSFSYSFLLFFFFFRIKARKKILKILSPVLFLLTKQTCRQQKQI